MKAFAFFSCLLGSEICLEEELPDEIPDELPEEGAEEEVNFDEIPDELPEEPANESLNLSKEAPSDEETEHKSELTSLQGHRGPKE